MKSVSVAAALCCFHFIVGTAVHAQLRPLDPIYWDAFHTADRVHLSGRVAWFDEQRASLAGTVGQLIELGEVRLLVRASAVVLEFAGTPQRFFEDERSFAAPAGGADPAPADGRRHDSGEYRVATLVRLTAPAAPVLAILRFGARLPTTDNRVGLDRDQTDFFALVGAQHRRDALRFAAELGVGINGTRVATYEQSDVLVYAGTVEYAGHFVSPAISLVGHDDLAARSIRGNEDVAEVRARLRVGTKRYLEAVFVRGLRTFSPRAGVWIGGGVAFDWR